MPKDFENTKSQAELVREIKKIYEEISKLKSNLIDGDAVQLELITSSEKKLKALQKIYKENSKIIDSQVNNMEEYEDALISISNTLKDNNKFVQIQKDKFEAIKDISKAIGLELKEGAASNDKTANQVISMLSAYKNMQISIAEANKSKIKGNISEAERLDIIKRVSKEFQEIYGSIDKSKIKSEELNTLLSKMNTEAERFEELMTKSQVKSEQLDRVFGSFSGIPAMQELNTLLKTNTKDTLAFKAAAFALGAALANAAYNYFGTPIKAALQIDKERSQNRIDGEAAVAKIAKDAQSIPAKIEQERLEARIQSENEIAKLTFESAYAADKAAIEFSNSMKQGALEFNAAAEMALFGNKLGSINYGAAQMQLAGISAEQVAEAITTTGNVMGQMPSAKVASDMAVLSKRTGVSAESIANMAKVSMQLDGTTMDTALNMQEGMRAMAESLNIPLDSFMQEISDSSKEMLGYQIKSLPALAKQVAFAKSIGVSFNDIAKAGQSMVLNYKDSIKSEMQLSALLGKQVDLSEVRSKFAAGDTEGAIKALQAQGLNPAEMDMFQQQALTQATGMDLQTLMNIATGKGKTAELTAGNVTAANKSFLGKTETVQRQLEADRAVLSAKQAIIDAEFSQKMADAYLASPEYTLALNKQAGAAVYAEKLANAMNDAWLATEAYKKQIEETEKLNFVSSLKESFVEGGITLAGGALMNYAGKKLMPGAAGKAATNTFKTSRGLVVETAAKSAAKKATVKATEKAGAKAVTKIASKSAGKMLLKRIPGLNTVMSLGLAFDRFKGGDIAGAGLEALSGGASLLDFLVPGLGTGASLAIDAGIAARDIKKASEPAESSVAAEATTAGVTPEVAATSTPAFDNLQSILTQIKNNDHSRGILMYNKDREINGNLQKIVVRTHGTSQQLEHANLNYYPKLLNMTKNIQSLNEATVELLAQLVTAANKTPEVTIDGKILTKSLRSINQDLRTITSLNIS